MKNLIYQGDEGRKILFSSGLILLLVAVISAIVGFSVFASQSQRVLKQDLQETLEARANSFEEDLNRSLSEVNALLANPIFKATLVQPSSASSHGTLDALLSSRGFSSVKISNANQEVLYASGKAISGETFSTPLKLLYKAKLFWLNGWTLQLDAPIKAKNKILGVLRIEWPLKNANHFYSYHGDLSTTSKIKVCASGGVGEAICFPQNLALPPYKERIIVDGQNSSMARALLGGQGDLTDKNGEGQEVVSAYRPILSSGLGIVASIHTAELYQPIQKQWVLILPILSVSILIGVFLLYWQLSPLVEKIAISQEMLSKMAYQDPLTGLDNRAQITKNLNRALITAGKNQHYFALFFLDLDHFKEINDTFGHEGGDMLLKTVAARLQKVLRHTDLIGRFGGDEFIIIIENILNLDFVANKARLILASMADPLIMKGQEVFVRASIGVSVFPMHGETLESLMESADLALYRAKASGRNNFQIYKPDVLEASEE